MPLDLRRCSGLTSLTIRLALTLACAALLLAGLARPQAAHAACGGSAVLSGSCFEGGDGNLTADGSLLFADNTDWATISDELLFSDPVSPGTQFNNSSDEQNPTSWSLTSGEPSTNKLDITAAATRVEKIGSDIWMHVGFTMKAAAGSANVLVELNRSAVPVGSNPLPVRSANDALIQFTGNANQAARIGLCQWVGNQFGQGPGGNGSFGWYTTPLPGSLITSSNKDCTQISGGGNPTAVGKVNDGVVLNNLKDETQRVELTGPSAGTFTLTFDGQATAPVSRTASPATVQAALVALSNIDVADVSVTAPASGGPFTVRFTGAHAATDVPQMTGAGSALLSISTLGQGGASTYLPSPPFSAPTIPADVFGEMSINLTQALGAGGANACFNFGSVWLHTYNGNSISSIMADYVGPQSLLGASSCAVSVDKKVAVSPDGVNAPAAGSAFHEGTPSDPSSAQVGDYLWYRLALTNSGTVALTPNVVDSGCDLSASPTPVERRNSSNVLDPTPASFDGGDVWTYLCKHQLAAGDPEPYVNTVKATGTNGGFTTPEVQDSTSTTGDGSLTVKKSFTGPFEPTHRVDLLVGDVVKAASVGDGGTTPAVPVAGGSSVSFGEAFAVGTAAQYTSSAACVDTKGTANSGDDTPVGSSFDAGTLAGSVTVAGRKAILCTISNARRTGTIKVAKDLDPNADAGRFNLSVDGVPRDVANGPGTGTGSFGDQSASSAITVATGTHSVAEAGAASPLTSLADYVTSVSCTKNGGGYIAPTAATSLGSLSVADGDTVVCTFVNTHKGSLRVVKDFSGPFESGHRVTISAAGSQRNVAGGPNDGSASFADLDSTPAITVDGGSTNGFSEAYLAPASATQYTASAECRDGGGQLVSSSFSPATLTGSVTVAPGVDITCTITNARRTGTLKVVKHVAPVNGQLGDPGRFDLQVDGTTERADAADGDATDIMVLPTGSHTVAELAGTATSLADYDASVACKDDLGGDVATSDAGPSWSLTLAAGEDVICTITNVRKKGHVKLIKEIVPVDAQLGDPGKFDLSINGEGDYDATKTDAIDGDFVELTVPNGPVDLSEAAGSDTSLGDYVSSYRCVAAGHDDVTGSGTTINDLPVAAGDNWVCTLTNVRKQAGVRLTKVIVAVDSQLGDPGKFDLVIDGEGTHDASKVDAVDGDSIEVSVPNGTVDLSESAGSATDLGDYTSTYRCVNGADGSDDDPVTGEGTTITNLVVTDGDRWECTFTNARKQGTVKLVKDIVPVNAQLGDPGKFNLRIDGAGAYDAVKADAGDGDSVERTVPNGTVDLSEAAGTDTSLSDYTTTYRCVAAGRDDVTGTGTTIDDLPVADGDDWVCTLTNTRKKGTVTVIKQLSPTSDDGLFNLSIMGPLDHNATGHDRGHNGSISIDLPTGTASVAETAGTGTTLASYISSYRCVNAAQGSEDEPLKGAGTSVPGVVVSVGDDWVCTFTNVRKPRIIVKKLTEPASGDATAFAFTSDLPAVDAGDDSQAIGDDGSFSLKHGQQVSTLVAPGSYSVTEGDVYAQNHRLKSAVCEETIVNDERFGLESNAQSAGDRTRSFTADPGDVITCTFVNEQLVGIQVVAKTPKSQSAYLDQNVSYSYEVTNTGTSDLTDVTVADDKCPGPAARQADVVGDNDAVLEPGEKWLYTCSVAASAIFSGDITQVTNTVTVNAKDQAGKPVAPSTDTAVTNLLKPSIAIDKTGPATASAGDLLTYSLKVTNTGNTTFSDGMVVLTDAQCQAPPALLSRNGDTSPESLSPGESWTYSCQVQTQIGQQQVDNLGSVKGTDQGGRVVTASDTASTALSQPASQALPNPPLTRIPGSAKLRGTVGCATASYARATISGKQIKSVTFYVNGKKLRTLTKPTAGQFSLRVMVRSLRYGAHKVTAKVVFVDAARTKSKTLTLQFSRCQPRVVQPKFTG